MIPDTLKPRTWLAGGYAANSDLANDRDYFILDCPAVPPELQGLRQAPLSTYQFAAGVRAVLLPAPDTQIICVTHKTIQELLDDFDITCHMIAISPSGETVYGRYYTPTVHVHKPLFGLVNPVRTLSRYIKLCYRYHATPNLEDLFRIADALTLQQACLGEQTCS